MPLTLREGDKGPEVADLQTLLVKRGFPVTVDGDFGPETCDTVWDFQSKNLDQHGQPLVPDGVVGPLTWWSLTNPKPVIEAPSAVDYKTMPPSALGGSILGRKALEIAIEEMKAGAGEVGGNNCGPWVKKFLGPAGLAEGNPWCASFVSWCYLLACGGDKGAMPFTYCPGARNLLEEFRDKGWAYGSTDGCQPKPGDIVVWWRDKPGGWKGHVGLVHQVKDGMLYTIEGNKSSNVQGFSYVLSRMDKLLGFGHVP